MLELQESTSKNDRLFIICSSDGEVVSSEDRNDSLDRNSIRSLDSERDDNSSTVSIAKSDICIYHDSSMSSVEVTLHEPPVGTPQTSTCSSGSHDYSRVWQVDSLDEYIHDISMDKHGSSCNKYRSLESNIPSHKNRESFEDKIKRLSRPTKSFVSYLAEGPKATKENSSEHQEMDVRVYNNYTFIQHLSRPTKAYLSYLSQGPTGAKSRGETNKASNETNRKKSNHIKISNPQRKPEERTGPSNQPSVYERLYIRNKIIKANQPIVQNGSKVNSKPKNTNKTPKPNNVSQVHSRLYDYSKKTQVQGKQLREEIAEKLRTKNEVKFSKKKISLDRACRLYYVGMESIKAREAMVQNE